MPSGNIGMKLVIIISECKLKDLLFFSNGKCIKKFSVLCNKFNQVIFFQKICFISVCMLASLIIPYYKDIIALELILTALNKQSAKGQFEVIIAEDDNAAETKEFLVKIS